MKSIEQYIGRTKGVLTIMEILNRTSNNKYTIVKCKCSRCGQYSEVRLDRLTTSVKYAELYCSKCKQSYLLEQAEKKFIGRTNGVLTCTKVEGYMSDKSSYKSLRLRCMCSNCGSETVVRSYRLLDRKHVPVSCSSCYYSVLGNATHKRYYSMSGISNEQEYRTTQKLNACLSKFKSGARTRNLDWKLDDSEALSIMQKPCYYCGENPCFGIDRIDSLCGYTAGNVVPCCGMCNVMKNKFSQDAFLNRIYKIYNTLHLEGSTTISKESTSQAYGDGNGDYPKKDSDIV